MKFKHMLPLMGFIGRFAFISAPAFAQAIPNNTNHQSNPCDSLNSIVIHEEIDFNVSPQTLYQALLNAKEFSSFSEVAGLPPNSATIDSAVGGVFSLFGGHIVGRILELATDQRIVEAWRVVDWPAGVYSIVRFEFISKGSGTRLIFDHTGFPKGLKDHLALGWQQHYWDPLQKYFK